MSTHEEQIRQLEHDVEVATKGWLKAQRERDEAVADAARARSGDGLNEAIVREVARADAAERKVAAVLALMQEFQDEDEREEFGECLSDPCHVCTILQRLENLRVELRNGVA